MKFRPLLLEEHEISEIVGAAIHSVVAVPVRNKLRNARIGIRATALALSGEVDAHGFHVTDEVTATSGSDGVLLALKNPLPNITDGMLQLSWSDIAKLIRDDSFCKKYIHGDKPESPAEQPEETREIPEAQTDTPPADLLESPQNAPALFDYGELSDNEADKLREIEQTIKTETASYFTVLGAKFKAAQELLANHSGGTFERWYTSVGFKRQTVYRLIQRYEFMCSPKLGEHRTDVFEELPLSLSCEISQKNAPPELVEKVLSGDITSHKEYQKLLADCRKTEHRNRELDDQVSALKQQVKELESRPAETVVEKQEVIPEGYVSPEEHQRALDEEEKRSKKLSDEIMRLKSTQSAERSGKLADRIVELEQQLAEQQRETTKAYGKASKASYDSETKGRALEEAQQKNAELEKELAELRSAEKTDPAISEKLFKVYKREVTAALTGLVVFASAPENREYKRKAAELLESYMKTLQEDSK